MTLLLKIENLDQLDNGESTSLKLDRHGAVIGRSPHADWSLPDPKNYVSSTHCEIDYRDGTYTLIDKSTNGTSVNEATQRLPGPHEIKDGDVIVIGHYRIRASLPGAQSAAAAAAPPPAAKSGWGGWDDMPGPGNRAEETGQAGWSQPAPAASPGWGDAAPAAAPGWGATPAPAPSFSSPAPSSWSDPAPQAPASSGWGDAAPAASPAASGWGDPAPAASPGWGAPSPASASSPAPAAASWGAEPSAAPAAPAWGDAPAAAAQAGGWGDVNPAAAPKSGWDPLSTAGAPETPADAWASAPASAMSGRGPLAQNWSAPKAETAPGAESWGAPSAAQVEDVWGQFGAANVVDWARGGFGQAEPKAPPSVAPTPVDPPSMAHVPARPADDGAWEAFIAASGVPADLLRGSPRELGAAAGGVLKRLVAGLVVMLEARARAKAQLGAQSTTLELAGNNPLKFARSPDRALAQLMSPPERGFMDSGRAVEDSFQDLQAHQMATLAAMQGALRATLDRFSPDAINARAETRGLLAKILPSARNAALWEAYAREFDGVARGSEEAFLDIFSKAFRTAYEKAAADMKRGAR